MVSSIMLLFNFLPLIALTLASPIPPISPLDYSTIQLLLYIEQTEAYLFKQGCDRFTLEEYKDAGLDTDLYTQVCAIETEKAAVVHNFHSLFEALGKPSLGSECEYEFAFTGPSNWIESAKEEGMVAVAAYLGATKVVADDFYRQFIASIATTEARHDAYLRAESRASPAPSIYDTPVPPTWAYNLVQKWVKSCPEPLGYALFPALTVETPAWLGSVQENVTVYLSRHPSDLFVQIGAEQPLYLAIVTYVPDDKPLLIPVEHGNVTVNGTGMASIPGAYIAGVAFVALTTFVELDSVEDLVQCGTLAGPVELLLS